MNTYTLKFKNAELEQLYANYLIASLEQRITSCLYAMQLICMAVSINEFIKLNLQIAITYAGLSLISLLTQLGFKNIAIFRSYYLVFSNQITLTFPMSALYIITMSEELTLQDKIVLHMINNLTLFYFQVYQNFIVSVVVEINKNVVYGVSLYLLLGFNMYLILFVVYSMYWMSVEYQTQKDKRQKFQAAHINQSLWQIIDKSVKNKVVSFTYDEENIKYDLEIFNKAAKQYLVGSQFNDQVNLSYILSNIYISIGSKVCNIGNFISRKFLNNQQNMEVNYMKFNGFYENTKNKIKLRLYIQQIPKLKFILNIQSYSKDEILKQGQGWLIQKYEVMTVKILNKIANTLKREQQVTKSSIHLKAILNTYQKKLKLLNVLYSSNYQLTIKEFDIVDQLCTLLMHTPINYYCNIPSKFIITDLGLTKLLFQLIIKYIVIVRTLKMQVVIEFYEKGEDLITITFQFQGIKRMSKSSFLKLLDAIDKLIQLVGIRNSLEFSPDGISFDIVTKLEQKFTS